MSGFVTFVFQDGTRLETRDDSDADAYAERVGIQDGYGPVIEKVPAPKFAVGDAIYSPYTCQRGTIESVQSWERPYAHAVTGDQCPGEHWYYVRNADGTRDLLSDTRMRAL